ncbi:MAG: AAA family ATPase [Candidatus Micrarchaeales archaeon]
MIVCVIGLPGSGKSTVAKILKRKGFHLIEMGDQVREKMRQEKMKPLGDNIRKYSIKMRSRFGRDIVARMAAKKIAPYVKNNKNVAIVGVRDLYEVKYFKKTLKKFYIIGIVSPLQTRFERLHDRGRVDDPTSMSKFSEREKLERRGYGVSTKKGAGAGIDRLFGMTDYIVFNTDTPVMLARNVNILVSKLRQVR